jgi:DNA-binding CsgD family transcriptional regulator/Tfp pilus assembly protein PilF
VARQVAALVDEGRAALRVGDGAGARRAFERALVECPTTGEVIEGLARAAYLELDFPRAIEDWERAYAAYREAGDPVGAVRVARQVAYMYGAVMGDGAVMNGWIARAQTLLPEAGDSAEAGWVSLNLGMFEDDRTLREKRLRSALEIARRFDDRDLEFVSLAYLGASIVHDGRTDEGMALLDEALAAVAGSEVNDFSVLEEIFCQLFSACEHAHDVARADQWIRVGDSIARRRNLPAVSAFCRTHYGGVLTAAGRWPEADAALTEAARLWGLGFGSMRDGALVRLADLRVRQGRFEEAERLLDGLDVNQDTAHSLAAIHLARGDTTLAKDVLERALDEVDSSTAAAVPLLAVLVDVHLAAGESEEANAVAEAIELCASGSANDYLVAVAALARGRICLAVGTGEPDVCLREAIAAFSRAQMPMEVARCRLELARALLVDRPEVAIAETRTALDAFERLQAVRDVDAAAAVLRQLGVRVPSARRGDGLLTKREAEVLTLLGLGLSNPEIADRLYISRKTVEHHVGNILAKLGLRSRAEAAAYAVREKPGDE